jgi:hypothetical protein
LNTKTYRDLKIASLKRYEELVNNQLKESSGDQAPADRLREAIEKGLIDEPDQVFTILPELEKELKKRLAPFLPTTV